MKKTILFLIVISITYIGMAQEEESAPKSNEDLAKELANPNATLGQMLFPIDFIGYSGDQKDANNQSSIAINFQPSLPIPISNGLNLYVRPLIPVHISQPVLGENGFENEGGLGNISADIAIGKTWSSKWVTLVGVFGSFPTATNEDLKASQVTIGPEFLVALLTDFGAVGFLVSQAWGIGNPDDLGSTNANVTAGQYFYTINLENGWQINASPTYSYNHNGTDGNKLTFPLGTGIQKVLKVGNIPLRLGLQCWYYLAAPDTFGPQYQFRFTIAPVVPLPW